MTKKKEKRIILKTKSWDYNKPEKERDQFFRNIMIFWTGMCIGMVIMYFSCLWWVDS